MDTLTAPPPSRRIPLAKARAMAEKIAASLQEVCTRVEIAGSIRRGRPDCGDLDFVVMTDNPVKLRERVMQRCRIRQWGPQNILAVMENGVTLDIFIAHPGIKELFDTKPSNWGTLLLCRTGSVAHNVYLVETAKRAGMKWNPYHGLYSGNKLIASETEQDIFTALGLPFVPPEKREV